MASSVGWNLLGRKTLSEFCLRSEPPFLNPATNHVRDPIFNPPGPAPFPFLPRPGRVKWDTAGRAPSTGLAHSRAVTVGPLSVAGSDTGRELGCPREMGRGTVGREREAS